MKAKYMVAACVFASASAMAWELGTDNYVPGRYVQITILNVTSSTLADRDSIISRFTDECGKAEVEQCQLAVYEEGTRAGDGVRAVGTLKRYGGKLDTGGLKYQEADNLQMGRLFEHTLGYELKRSELKEIYEAYAADASEAARVFREIPLLLHFYAIPGLTRTEYSTPLLEISENSAYKEDMFAGMQIHFNFSAIDPLLKRARPGSDMGARCYALDFTGGFMNFGCSINWADFINN